MFNTEIDVTHFNFATSDTCTTLITYYMYNLLLYYSNLTINI